MRSYGVDKNMILETKISRPRLKFFDIDDSPFRIYGIWRDGDRYYRIPRAVAEKVSHNVHEVCANSTGGRIRFVTDSKYIAVKVNIDKAYTISFMTFTGTLGLDVYADGKFAGSFRPPLEIENNSFEAVVDFPDVRERVITIHTPLYCDLKDLYVGIDSDASLRSAPDYKYEKPIVYYGSSITNGACASRPGLTYEAMISRMLDTNHHNLGFGGSAKAELAMAEYVAGLDMSIFVYDYDHNAPTVEYLKETHERMFKIVREKNPNLPIVMISRPKYDFDEDRDRRFAVIKETYDNAVASGDKNVYILRGSDFFDEIGGDYTIDGTHPTDLGFYFMAKGIAPTLKMLLES